jgi:hypothetical protein
MAIGVTQKETENLKIHIFPQLQWVLYFSDVAICISCIEIADPA